MREVPGSIPGAALFLLARTETSKGSLRTRGKGYLKWLIMESEHDSLAERSKAVAQGAIPKGRGFEPHSCHLPKGWHFAGPQALLVSPAGRGYWEARAPVRAARGVRVDNLVDLLGRRFLICTEG